LADTEEKGGRLTYTWEMAQPMANYLAAVGMGDFVLEQTASPGGVTIRDYYARDLAEEARSAFASTGRALDYFVGLFGPYPFDSYGVFVPDVLTDGSAMENQTMSLFGRDTVEESMASDFGRELFLSHELAHQWFGNSVTLAQWKDVWLNEGFAMYASWMWLEHEYGADALQRCVDNAYHVLSSEDGTLLGDPGKYDLFGRVVYERGGLTLHALRGALGDDLFVEVLRTWAAQNAYSCVTTRDFIDLVKAKTIGLSGFDAEAFFDIWLYQEELPDRAVSSQSTR
jgi:aminopeptidase N